MKKVILVIVCLFYSGLIIGQCKTKSIKIPLVKCKQVDFFSLLDSAIDSEKACKYYQNDLMFSVEFISNPDNKTEFGVHIGSSNEKRVLLGLNPIAYLSYKGHNVFVYNKLPDTIFEKGTYVRRFYYRDYVMQAKIDKRKPPVIFGEDDSYSIWTYYYKGGKFNFIEHFGCNDKQ